MREENFAGESMVGIKWAAAILSRAPSSMFKEADELVERLLELTYYEHSLVFEAEVPKLQLATAKDEDRLLEGFLKISLYEKDKELSNKTIKELILDNDLYTISTVLQVMELAFTLINNLSQSPDTQLPLVSSGWIWATLYFSMYSTTKNYNYLTEYFEIDEIVIIPLFILHNVCMVSITAKNILGGVREALRRLMGDYLFGLISGVSGGKEPSEERVKEVLESLNSDVNTPRLVWNASNRKELKRVLQTHLTNSFATSKNHSIDDLENFEYESYRKEIIIGSVFVKAINANPLLPLDDVPEFFTNAFSELEKCKEKYLEGNDSVVQRAATIMEALKNVLLHQKLVELPEFSPSQLNTLAEYMWPPRASADNKTLEATTVHAFEFLIELSRDSKSISLLLSNKTLTLFTLHHLCNIQTTPLSALTFTIVQNMFRHNEVIGSLVDYGFFIPLLKILFDNEMDVKCRAKAMSCVMKFLVHEVFEAKKELITSYVPYPMLERLSISWSKKVDEVLEFIDNDYIDPYITWNKKLSAEVKAHLQDETRNIARSIEKGCEDKWIDAKKTEVKVDYKQSELVIEDVIVPNYIKAPFSKLNVLLPANARNHWHTSYRV